MNNTPKHTQIHGAHFTSLPNLAKPTMPFRLTMLTMKKLLELLLPYGSESFVSMAMARLYTTDAVNRG